MMNLFGMYRGVVTDPNDPSNLCRLAVSVPAVMGSASVWAFPHKGSPTASAPSVNAGDGVWVMFEGGDSAFPIWTGFYGPDGGEGPAAAHTHALGDLPSTLATDDELLSHTGAANPHTQYVLSSVNTPALALKAPLASPALTGTPTAPTAAVNTNNTQLATTAFVNAEIANDAAPAVHSHSYLPLAGGELTGNLTVSTPTGVSFHSPGVSVVSVASFNYSGQWGLRFLNGWSGDSGALVPLQIGAPIDGNSAARVDWVVDWTGSNYAAVSHGAHYVQASTTVFTTDGNGQAYIGGLAGFSTVIQCNGDFAAHARAVSLRGDFGSGGFGLMNMDASKSTRCNWITC